QHLHAELGIKVTPQHVNRLLKQMGLSTRSKPASEEESDKSNRIPTLRSHESIEIGDLDSTPILEASEMWNVNPLTNI
ncbi:MAG: helix-turn-helix domain-containing protein, partial [Cyanobacteria bacterium P01_G01_bin.49]